MRTKLYGNRVDPACEYCMQGHCTPDGQTVLCLRRGAVAADYRCWHYEYDPLRRVPKPRVFPHIHRHTNEKLL